MIPNGVQVFDQSVQATGTGATVQPGSVTPAQTNSLAIWALSDLGATAAGWDYFANGLLVKLLTSAAPINPSATISPNDWANILAIFPFVGTLAATVTAISVDGSNVVTVTCDNGFVPGQIVKMGTLTTATFLNSANLKVLTANGAQFTAAFAHAAYGTTADSGTVSSSGIIQVSTIISGGISTPHTIVFTDPVKAGSTIFIYDSAYGALQAIVSVTDDLSPASTYSVVNCLSGTRQQSIAFAQNVAAGSPTITVNLTGLQSGSAIYAIEFAGAAPTLVSIAVTPTSPSIALGGTQAFTAIGTYSDSSTADITSTVTWASSAPGVATIASGGLATSVSGGTTNISASLSAITSNSAVLTATLFSISGNAGIAGATVSWTGTASGSTTADGSGNYTIPSLGPGTYTITPSLSGYSFSPTSQNETISSAIITNVNFTATVIPVPPPSTPTKSYIPLPFTQRTTAAVAVFRCIGVASPEAILRTLAPDVPTIIALQLEYAQLVDNYDILRRQDIVAQRAVLVAAVTDAVTIVTSLHATVQAMTATGDNAFVLKGLQSVVGSALQQIKNVQFDES